jgi:NitT/TauT family transport system permease protein
MLGSVGALRRLLIPVVDLLRSIPVSALYPIFVLSLGIANRSKIAMVAFSTVLVIVLHAASALLGRSRVREKVLRLYGASWLDTFRMATIFEILPSLMTGLRVALGLALIVATLTEMFMGAKTGLGQRVMEAYSVYDLANMFAYVLCLGLTGLALNRAAARVEARVHRWSLR